MSSLELDAFKYIEGGCHLPNDRFMRNRMMVASQIDAFRNEFNNTGLYLSAYWYDSEEVKDANLYGNFYLDFDNEDDFERARRDAMNAVHYLCTYNSGCRIPERFIRVFFSGKKGLHIVVPAIVFGIEPDRNLNEYFRMMAELILIRTKGDDFKKDKEESTDLKIYDRRRLFRVPNSIHQSTGLFKVPLTTDELKTATYEEILFKAKTSAMPTWEAAHEINRARTFYLESLDVWKNRFEKRFSKDKKFDLKPLDFTPACIQELIEAGPQKGKRNNTAAALVSFFKRQGYSEQESWDSMVEWNNGSLSDQELKTCMKSVYHGDYQYGCSTLEKLATCVEHQCKLWRGKSY
jgi:hypothetical protein